MRAAAEAIVEYWPTGSSNEEVTVTTSKGTRAARFPVNTSDAIHVYSDDGHIWIQIRRDVPTEQDIGRSSFKVAVCVQPGTAHKLAMELMTIAVRNQERMKAKASASAKPTPTTGKTRTGPA